ncbi:hypothetical protein H5410_003265 [Solanum commersonii]|uniref:Uncharacterized protein n=1 Tax=Solanum commersonii TaxID=4109 RepID=A0A9J6B4K4_SOLCO|nr:hypothetical protein H5410_003265 [Solanum commersonii]
MGCFITIGYENLSLDKDQNQRIQETQTQIMKMKPFGSSSLQNPLKLRAKILKSTILYVNYNNFLTLKTTTLTSIYTFHRFVLQRIFRHRKLESPINSHHRALCHWATWYCFTKLLSDALTAPFFRRLDPFLQGSAHWNKRRSKTFWRLARWTRRSSCLHFFILSSLFVPFRVVSMLFFKLQIPEI